MRVLTFLVRSFAWEPFSQTLPEAPPAEPGAVQDAVVAFIQVEAKDEEAYARAFRHLLKHLKWLANKKGFRTIVLHSFTHLGGENAPPELAERLFSEMSQRLESTGYEVAMTPFGYFCSWQLDVYGESLAKVYKAI
jgi:D-Tyr-tRNAtyr deacylase